MSFGFDVFAQAFKCHAKVVGGHRDLRAAWSELLAREVPQRL